jgi:histidine ammonia-lyase
MSTFQYGTDQLTVGQALALSRGTLRGALGRTTREAVRASAALVRDMARSDRPTYGVNTGFGPLCTTRISAAGTSQLQVNLLMSHSVGVGKPVATEVARLMLILKLQALAQGYSGITETTLDRILWHLEHDCIPVVPRQGSVGASGDLAPLAHLFLPLLGLGEVDYQGTRQSAGRALRQAGLEPLTLAPKEGLALINGTQFIAAHAVAVLERLHGCLSQADLIAALMVDGLAGSAAPFRPELHALRPFPGVRHVAARLAGALAESEILASHADCHRVQDPYSLRCVPQVHGASRAAWLHLREAVAVELNAVTDNPVILPANEAISGGNFHGQPLALPLDYACLAAAEVGNISDRRSYLSLTGLGETPKLLLRDTGLHSGFMILQYTSAALASENKTLCFPASADSIVTSLGQEDHVSMGSISGRKALQVIDNLERILAIELLCAAQAIDFRRPLRSSPLLEALHTAVREVVAFAEADRVFAEDIDRATKLLRAGALLKISRDYGDHIESEYDELFEIF